MQILNASHRLIPIPTNPLRHIERIGRVCYKTEERMADGSEVKFVSDLMSRHHYAMIEHYRFIVAVDMSLMATLDHSEFKYLTFTHDTDIGRILISFSARALNDIYEEYGNHVCISPEIEALAAAVIYTYPECDILFTQELRARSRKYMYNSNMMVIDNFGALTTYEYRKHAWYSVDFVCDRGVSHELVRHRDASFAQESTRYCNYSKQDEIAVIQPFFWPEDHTSRLDIENGATNYEYWECAMRDAQWCYMGMTKANKAQPQQARSVLPNSLKTEIIITAQVYEWEHIFELRALGLTGAPHPQMVEIMKPTFEEFKKKDMLSLHFRQRHADLWK